MSTNKWKTAKGTKNDREDREDRKWRQRREQDLEQGYPEKRKKKVRSR